MLFAQGSSTGGMNQMITPPKVGQNNTSLTVSNVGSMQTHMTTSQLN